MSSDDQFLYIKYADTKINVKTTPVLVSYTKQYEHLFDKNGYFNYNKDLCQSSKYVCVPQDEFDVFAETNLV